MEHDLKTVKSIKLLRDGIIVANIISVSGIELVKNKEKKGYGQNVKLQNSAIAQAKTKYRNVKYRIHVTRLKVGGSGNKLPTKRGGKQSIEMESTTLALRDNQYSF